MNRRELLIATALLVVSAVELSACSWSADSAKAKATEWNIVRPPTLVKGDPALVFDLRPSLPPHVRRGGRFAVSSTGAALPTGVMLSPEGVLSVTSDATRGITTGVVFEYEEPAS
jgi:hypothetical protein